MKKTIIAFLATLGCSFSESSSLQGAISELESTTRTIMLVSSAFFFIAGLLLTAIGAFIYFRKIKGAYKPAAMLKAAAFGLGGLGIISLLAGILGFAIFFLAPALIRGLLAAPG